MYRTTFLIFVVSLANVQSIRNPLLVHIAGRKRSDSLDSLFDRSTFAETMEKICFLLLVQGEEATTNCIASRLLLLLLLERTSLNGLIELDR